MKLFLPSLLLFSTAAVTADSDIYQLHGSGTTNPSKCYWSIMETLHEQAGVPVRLSYRAVGSSTGIREFEAGYNQNLPTVFGSGDIPISAEVFSGIAGNVIHLPVLAGAVSFFHSVPGNPSLNLTACIIGQMYTGAITSWGDQQVVNINPDLSEQAKNTPVTVARRVAGSSSTASATEYLFGACDDEEQRIPEDLVAALPEWENFDVAENMLQCEGSGGVTSCILDNAGTIGYIDSGHGVSAGLNEVRLHNKDSGVYRTSQDSSITDAITLATLPTSPLDDFSDTTFLNAGGVNTWPIVLMTYIYVRTDLASYIESPQEQTLLIAFLRSLYDDEYVQQCADNFGFTTLTGIADVKAYAEDAIDSLASSVSANATEWFFEATTTAIDGAQPFVFSVKREQIADIKIAALESDVAAAEAMAATVTRLETKIAELEAEMVGSGSISSYSSQDETQLKAAVVLSSISFLLWMILGASFIFKCVSGGGPSDGGESQV